MLETFVWLDLAYTSVVCVGFLFESRGDRGEINVICSTLQIARSYFMLIDMFKYGAIPRVTVSVDLSAGF